MNDDQKICKGEKFLFFLTVPWYGLTCGKNNSGVDINWPGNKFGNQSKSNFNHRSVTRRPFSNVNWRFVRLRLTFAAEAALEVTTDMAMRTVTMTEPLAMMKMMGLKHNFFDEILLYFISVGIEQPTTEKKRILMCTSKKKFKMNCWLLFLRTTTTSVWYGEMFRTEMKLPNPHSHTREELQRHASFRVSFSQFEVAHDYIYQWKPYF